MRRPENSFDRLPPDVRALAPDDLWAQVEADLKYEGYIRRELEAVARQKRQEEVRVPDDLDYAAIPGLRNESRQKLAQVRPSTLGQASRISGVTPADLALLSVWVHRARRG